VAEEGEGEVVVGADSVDAGEGGVGGLIDGVGTQVGQIRPNPSLHRPSGPSRSFVLASLRALHLDRPVAPERSATRALTRATHTGKAPEEHPNGKSR